MQPRSEQSGVAVVTGGGRGIGLGISRYLANAGYATAILDIDATLAKEAALSITQLAGKAIGIGCDISHLASVKTAVLEVVEKLGAPTALVNNAAIRHVSRLEEIDPEDWDREISVNISGAFYCTQTIGKVMLESGGGAIVNISSTSAYLGHALRGAYSVTKAGLLGLTNLTAIEWGGRGIRCNAVCPGIIATEAHSKVLNAPHGAEGRRRFVPLNRLGTDVDIAAAVAFLVSKEAAFINGAHLVIDGGTMRALTSLIPTVDPEGNVVSSARDYLE